MKKYTFIGRLSDYKQLNYSIYGNPAYFGWFENEQGEKLSGRTASDAACGYGFLNDRHAKRKLTYHITRNGNTIIDYIDIIQE